MNRIHGIKIVDFICDFILFILFILYILYILYIPVKTVYISVLSVSP